MSEIVAVLRAPRPAAPALASDCSLEFAPVATRFVLRSDAKVAELVGQALGVVVPVQPCRALESGGRSAIWLGPDEWLLLAEGEDAQALDEKLSGALAPHLHSLVDVSQRQAGLVLSGPRAARLLSVGCPLDLHPDAFPHGMAVRTVFAKAEIVLWRQGDDRFRLEVWRSFADYIVGLLVDAARGAPER